MTLAAIRNEGPMGAFVAARTEVIHSHDLGIIGCVTEAAVPILDWQEGPMHLLSDVNTVGFPYAVSPDENAFWVSLRALKGYVVTRRKLWSLPARPVGYEVSCRFPKGLSGAPLLASMSSGQPLLRLAGVDIGSGSSETDGDVSTFGEAIDVSELRAIKSEIIGGTFDELREMALASQPIARADFTKPVLQWRSGAT